MDLNDTIVEEVEKESPLNYSTSHAQSLVQQME